MIKALPLRLDNGLLYSYGHNVCIKLNVDTCMVVGIHSMNNYYNNLS